MTWQEVVNAVTLADTVFVYNVTMTNADTEYSQLLPAHTRKFMIHTRDESEFRLAFVTGKVATPTAPWLTVLSGCRYHDDLIDDTAITLYFASDSAGKIIEIVAWQ